ncbi:aminotransferase class I/II-fold pyridoxal phosphate-dependent enzyme [Wenyingzhuangia sp. IMCC45533]
MKRYLSYLDSVFYFCGMTELPNSLVKKVEERKKNNSFRVLTNHQEGVDFYSNDYLGFSRSKEIELSALELVKNENYIHGSTGSRLISGTHPLHTEAEKLIADFHNSPSALLYNSGYDANLGLFSSILQKTDIVLYDDLIHASIRDGIRLGLAKSFKFKHNNIEDLEAKLNKFSSSIGQLYVSVEGVYSMDGDTCPLKEVVDICNKYNAKLIVDEAHSTGVFGEYGQGLLCHLGLQEKVFARVHTFGKAMGSHGAVVLSSERLKDYLINYSRSFIYTTALPCHSVATIISSYKKLAQKKYSKLLQNKIQFFKDVVKSKEIDHLFLESNSAIQCCVFSGNHNVKRIEEKLKEHKIIVKAVLSPTVPKGKERIRICLHLFNSDDDILGLIDQLSLLIYRNSF